MGQTERLCRLFGWSTQRRGEASTSTFHHSSMASCILTLRPSQISALQILFSLLKHLSTSSTKSSPSPSSPQFHMSHFRKIVSSLLLCPPSKRPQASAGPPVHEQGKLDDDVRDSFIETWLSVYDDIRWFFLREAAYVVFFFTFA